MDRYLHPVLVSIQVAFAVWHILGSRALDTDVNPLVLALYREVLASALMLLLAYCMDGVVPVCPSHYFYFGLLGIFSFGNVVGAIFALKYTSPAALSMMQPAIPVLAMMISTWLGHEKLNRLKILGVIVSSAGAVAYISQGSDHQTSSGGGGVGIIGAALLVWQVGSMASLSVGMKRVLKLYPSTTCTAWVFCAGTVVQHPANTHLSTFNIYPWFALLYVTVFATLYPYNCYSWALSKAPSTTVMAYSTLQPLCTSVMSMLLLDKPITLHEFACGGLIILVSQRWIYWAVAVRWLILLCCLAPLSCSRGCWRLVRGGRWSLVRGFWIWVLAR
ncbi:unnamed protein product [Chrysoparadoxa australica]